MRTCYVSGGDKPTLYELTKMPSKKGLLRVEPGTRFAVHIKLPQELAGELTMLLADLDNVIAERLEVLVNNVASFGFAAGYNQRLRRDTN